MPVAEDGCEKEGNHFANNSIATRPACASLNGPGRTGNDHAVCRGVNRLAASLFEHWIVLLIPKDGIYMKAECRQAATVRRSKCID